jgi:hypothetical protein
MYASGSNDADGAIVSYHWTQIEGPMVALSDPTAMEPTFVLPPVVDSAETVLVFRLKVTDDRGLEAEDEVTVTVTEAGETGFEDGDPVFRTEDGSFLRISTTEPGSLVDLVNIPVPADAEGTAVLPYGLMEVEIKCDVPGDPVNLTLTLPEPASPEMAFLSMQADGAWAELADRAAFTEDGTGITLTLVDGGFGDRDGMENGRILLQAAPGEMTSADTDSTVDEDTGGSGGACFIAGMAASGSFPLVLFLGVGGILFGSMKLGRKRK